MSNELKLFTNGEVTTKDGRGFTRLVGGFGKDKPMFLLWQVSELLGQETREITQNFERNQDNFEKDVDYIDLKSPPNDFSEIKTIDITDFFKSLGIIHHKYGRAKQWLAFSFSGMMKMVYIVDIFHKEKIILFLKDYFNTEKNIRVYVPKIRYETSFSALLQTIFKNVLTFETQYSCCNNKYRIDFYEPTLKLAIEYDEEHHDYQQYEDNQRESEIHNELGCNFIRVKKGQELKGINEIFKYIYNKNNKMEVIA